MSRDWFFYAVLLGLLAVFTADTVLDLGLFGPPNNVKFYREAP